MANDNYKSDSFDLTMCGIILFVIAIFVVFFYVFPIFIIGPWAIFRLSESYVLGIFSETHVKLREVLLVNSWFKIGYPLAFQIERELMFHSTWLYLTLFFKPIYNIIFKKTLRHKLSRRLDLEEIIEQETHVWRYNRWLVYFNPSEESESVTKGRFAIREGMYSGLKRTKAITIDREEYKLKYDEVALKKVFREQLRYPNLGIDNLTGLHKQLFCVFATRESTLPPIFCKKTKRLSYWKIKLLDLICIIPNIPIRLYSNYRMQELLPKFLMNKLLIWKKHQLKDNEDIRVEYLGDLSCVLAGELDPSILHYMTDSIFNVARKNENIIELSKQHAFVETFLRRMLLEARSYGKLPPNHFSWLKLFDRELWYAMNDEILPSGSFEAMGIKSHFELEYQSRLPEAFPQVEQGVLLVKSIAENMTPNEFDKIRVDMEHPYSSSYNYDPNTEYTKHLERLKTDPSYNLRIFKKENNIKDD